MIHFLKKSFDDLSKEELYAIFKLRMEIFMLEQQSFYLDLDNQDQQAMHIFGVEEDSAAPLCYGRVTVEKSTAHIHRVCVHKDFRQAKLGSLLMQQLLSYIDSLTVDAIELDAQIYLQNFYSNYGFHAIGEPYDDAGILHVLMRKTL